MLPRTCASFYFVLITLPMAALHGQSNGGGGGLLGKYYSGTSFNTLVTTRIDPVVDFDWGTGSPGAGIPADGFSVRWTGQIQPLYDDTYIFRTGANDWVTLTINGETVISTSTGSDEGAITLRAGQLYPIQLEYYDNTGTANISLRWSSPNQAPQVVPYTRLSPTTLATPSAPLAYPPIPTSGAFVASWSTVSGATGYRLDVSTDSSFSSYVGAYNNYSMGTSHSQSITSLSPGKYYYRVRATWSGGTSANSAVVEVNVPTITLVSTQSYTSTGSTATYTVPSGANRIVVKAWGAGGGSAGNSNVSYDGGAGGFVSAAYAVTAAQTVSVRVGSGGASGGGASAAWMSSGFQVIAGGGGSAGGPGDDENGGGAGGSAGSDGANAPGGGSGGGGGTRTSGGSGTNPGTGPMTLSSGGSYGSNGGAHTNAGGDGGSGYYGGGGGTGGLSGGNHYEAGGGGGGGSSYFDAGHGYVAGSAILLGSSGRTPPATSDANYPSGAGYGGTEQGSGAGGGIVILAYTVATVPEIATQPKSVMVADAGASATFTVAATGFPAPTFRWQHNGSDVAGATNATLPLSNVQSGDTGNYTVIVTNSVGSVTSSTAALSIDTAPTAPSWISYAQKTADSVTVVWGPGTDNVAVVAYKLQRGSTLIATTSDRVFNDTGLSANTSYTYTAIAVDTAGKESTSNPTLTVTTDASTSSDTDGDRVPDSVESALGTSNSIVATPASGSNAPLKFIRPAK